MNKVEQNLQEVVEAILDLDETIAYCQMVIKQAEHTWEYDETAGAQIAYELERLRLIEEYSQLIGG